MVKTKSHLGRKLYLFCALALLSCAPTQTIETEPESTSNGDRVGTQVDSRTVRSFRLSALTSEALPYLSAVELPYKRLPDDSNELPTIELLATEQMIVDLEAAGHFRRLPRTAARGPIYNCNDIPTPQTSDYLWGYWTIREFAYQLAGADKSGGVETRDIGLTQTKAHPIVATRFGPTTPVLNPPTIYIVATQHAREWGAAGTAVGVMRELGKVLNDPSYRPRLFDALQVASVVVVPVANPDGYEMTRSTKRGQRGNLNFTDCPGLGVDLNRNHAATYAISSQSMNFFCTDELFIGNGPRSEAETQIIDKLIIGGVFPTNQPVVTMDWHTFSDLIVYPAGYKEKTDSDGPRCNYNPDSCLTADFQALRQIFGDTEQNQTPLFVDDEFAPAEPFRRDRAPTILYTSSGTLEDEGTYGQEPMLSATIEMFGADTGFFIECQPNREVMLANQVARQLDAIEHLAVAAPELVDGAGGTWLPNRIGNLASGVIHREYADGLSNVEARPEFVKPSLRLISNGRTLTTWVGASKVPLKRTRNGVHYELFSTDLASLTGDPLTLPCEVRTELDGTDQFSLDVIPECPPGGTVDLCDPKRLQASYWSLVDGVRGNKRDCWWSPTSTKAELLIGGYSAPWGSSHCTFSFSSLRDSNVAWPADAFTVERETSPGNFQLVWADAEPSPRIGGGATRSLLTHFYEANAFLSSGRTPQFRIRATDPLALSVKVFDPIVYCRVGPTP